MGKGGAIGQDARTAAGAELTATMVLGMIAGLMVLVVIGGRRGWRWARGCKRCKRKRPMSGQCSCARTRRSGVG